MTPILAFSLLTVINSTLKNTIVENCLNEIIQTNFPFTATIIIQSTNFSLAINAPGSFRLSSNHLHILDSIDQKGNHFIISYSSLEELDETFKFVKKHSYFDSRAKYVVLTRKREDINSILQVLWSYRLYKSVILLETLEGSVELFQISFEDVKCGENIVAEQISNIDNLFNPDLKRAFQNCPLRIIFSSYDPWIGKDYSGIFGEVLHIFAQKNGFEMVFQPENPIYEEELRSGYVLDAVIADINSGFGDIFVGLTTIFPFFIFETTTTVCDCRLYFVVPKPERMSFWKATYKQYSPVYWITILVWILSTYLIFSILAYIIPSTEKLFKDLGRNAMYIFAISLYLPSGKMSKIGILRVIFAAATFASIMVCTPFQAKLYGIFRIPQYENEITDVKTLLDSGLPMKFSQGLAAIFVFKGAESDRVLDTYIEYDVSMMDILDELVTSKDFATITDTGMLLMRPNLKKTITIFEIFYMEILFYMRKHHELFDVFNTGLKRIVESGLVEKLISETRWKYSLRDHTDDGEDQLFKLSLEHCATNFIGLGVGLLAAFTVFILEVILQKIKVYYRKYSVRRNFRI